MANFKLDLATAYSTFAIGDQLYIEDVSEAAADQAKYVTIGTLDTRWQGLSANLTDIAALTPADGAIIIGDGVNFVAESGETARASLGLGSAAIADATDFATAAQGALADSAVQPGDLAAVAYSGDYDDLIGSPTLGTLAAENWPASDGQEYVAKNGAWAVATGGGGGSSLPVVDETAIVYKTGQPTYTVTLDANALTAARTKTLQNTDATLAELETAQTFTAAQTFGSIIDMAGNKIYFTQVDPYGTPTIGRAVDGRIDFGWGGNQGGNIEMYHKSSPTEPGVLNFVFGGNNTGQFNVIQYIQSSGIYQKRFVCTKNGYVLVDTTVEGYSKCHIKNTNTASNTIFACITMENDYSGTPVAGFGTGLRTILKSSTTVRREAGRLNWKWATPTDATRQAQSDWTAYDYSAERTVISIGANGSAGLLSFFGGTPVARPSTYTLAATATRTMPTPESAFTGIDNAQVGSVYAQVADLQTLQTRLNSVEGVLRQLITDLASTSGYGLLVAS